jgi:prolyl 4-hydroxylase
LANGIVDGKRYGGGLSAHGLFEIGKELIRKKRFARSIEYLKLALKKTVLENESEIHPTKILLKIVKASERSGDLKTAVNTIDEAIYVEPSDKKLIDVKRELLDKFGPGKYEYEQEYTEDFDTAFTRAACNGKLSKSSKELSKLHCRLVSRKGYSLIAPFKLEEAHLDPYIVLFHDVIYDKEIEKLKKMSRPKLYQSVVFDETGGSDVSLDARISKVAWFGDTYDAVIQKISKRAEEMTGLIVTDDNSDMLQIQQYGIGGFYKAHYDGFEPQYETAKRGDNRIATALFYVSINFNGNFITFLINFSALRC